MRGLHHITIPPPQMLVRWYAAHNARRGRRHLISVPSTTIDLTAMLEDTDMRRRLPYNLRYAAAEERTDWAERMTRNNVNICIPSTVNPEGGHATRNCDSEQAALYYQYNEQPAPGGHRPRGYCDICWRDWPRFYQTYMDTARAQVIANLNDDLERWTRVARRDYRPR